MRNSESKRESKKKKLWAVVLFNVFFFSSLTCTCVYVCRQERIKDLLDVLTA